MMNTDEFISPEQMVELMRIKKHFEKENKKFESRRKKEVRKFFEFLEIPIARVENE